MINAKNDPLPSRDAENQGRENTGNTGNQAAGPSNELNITTRFATWREQRRAKWAKIEIHDRTQVRLSYVIAISTALYTIFAGWTLHEIHSGSADTHNLALAAKDSASWTGHQARDLFNDQRPRIWAKIPDSIHIEAGKPIRLGMEIFNYGKSPGIARARIRFEAAPGVIEKIRDVLRNHPDDFSVPEQLGNLKFLINPLTGKPFPVETPELILSKQDMNKLAAGTIDVAIYGRILYTDLDYSAMGERNTAYDSIFCFYIMRDGTTTSACPNKYDKRTNYEAYTNWAH
jgi:hypothetical protein